MFEAEEIIYCRLGSCVLWTQIQGVGEIGGGGGPLELHVSFWRNCSWEIQMQQNRKEKFFINNSAEALIPF